MQVQKTPIWGQEGGCNITVFFLSTRALQNVKSYRFLLAFFWPIFGVFKKHYKNRYLAHFQSKK